MIRRHASGKGGGNGNNGNRLAIPRIFTHRAGADVNRVFHRGGNAAVMLRGNEQNAVRRLDLLAQALV